MMFKRAAAFAFAITGRPRTTQIAPPTSRLSTTSFPSNSSTSTNLHERSSSSVDEETPLLSPKVEYSKSTVPPDFGAAGGSTIENKDTIFDEIDKALGVQKPPDIEVILADHLAYVANPVSKFLHLHLMRFGHIAIRYTTSDGKQRVMNILGDFEEPDAEMINFVKPSDYFYGTRGWETYAQQGGVYNRPFVGVRIENVSKGATDALHAYYKALSKASAIGDENMGGSKPGFSNRGAVRFQLVEVQISKLARVAPSPFDKMLYKVADFFREAHERSKTLQGAMISPSSSNKIEKGMADVRQATYMSGNCAQWISSGLSFAGLIRRPRLFPKNILVDLLEEEVLRFNRTGNVNVVYYEEVPHANKRDPDYKFIKSAKVSPIRPVRNIFYSDMSKLANAIVSVPEDQTRAIVEKVTPKRWPGNWLTALNSVVFYVPALVAVGLVQHVGPIGPTVAVIWLFANWWLY